MAEKRQPNAIEVNGAYLFVRDPNAAAGDLFENYQRVTGLSSFTLPAEVGGTNEIQLMDGTVQFASRKGVGTITGAIGALDAHVAQQFMEEAALAGSDVQIAIVRLAVEVLDREIGTSSTIDDFFATGANANRKVTIPAANAAMRADFRNTVLAGHLFAVEAADRAPASDPVVPSVVSGYRGGAVAADIGRWQRIVMVEEDGSFFIAAPGLPADGVDVAADMRRTMFIRRPGAIWKDLLVKVNGFDSGDFQQGSAVSGNCTFTPATPVPAKTVEYRTTLTQSDTDGSYTV